MMTQKDHPPVDSPPVTTVERLTQFRGADVHDLCDAAELAILDGGGFGWVEPPQRELMERYWRGVVTVPGRSLIAGRLDGVIAGSAQLVRPPPNNEAQSFSASLTTFFVAPWGRGHGLAREIIEAVEEDARADGFETLQLDVRESQEAAIQLYRALGFEHWGTNPLYARVGGRTLAGLYFSKTINGHTGNGNTSSS